VGDIAPGGSHRAAEPLASVAEAWGTEHREATIGQQSRWRQGQRETAGAQAVEQQRHGAAEAVDTSTDKHYSGGRKPIYSGVFRNRQC
jgi:hypothetical protein